MKNQLIQLNQAICDWNQWIKFFLNGIVIQSNKNIEKSKTIIELYNEMKERFTAVTHSSFSINVLDCLFKKPIISASELARNAGIKSASTANTLFKKLLSNQLIIVEKQASGTRPAIFNFNRLIEIVDE